MKKTGKPIFFIIIASYSIRHLAVDPGHQEIDDPGLEILGERDAEGDMVPFIEAAAAAGGGGMHRLEYRVPVHRRLLAVVHRKRRGELLPHEILRVAADRLNALFFNVCPVHRHQVKR